MMIIGCDLHTRYQQIAMLDTETGEEVERRLEHESGEARTFYSSLQGPVRVGIEATGHTHWFEAMLAELGHELWMGDAAKIRASVVRKQKTDARDAEHLLNLLRQDRFPQIWRPSRGWPALPRSPFPFRNCGCPVLAFFARAGTMLPVPWGLSCPPDCIVPTALVTCTLSPALATGDCLLTRSRDLFLSILEQTRQRYRFVVVGYVVMPEHIHLLLTEPEVGTPSTVMQVLKQRTARALLPTRNGATRANAICLEVSRDAERSGRRASTTSTYGPQRSAWKR